MTPETTISPDKLPPPVFVQDAEAFAYLLEELASADVIAVDTEADSFFHYREKVCLIQITIGERDWLVDPLGGFDIAGLGVMLADPNKTKVFHDGEYDVLIMKREHGFRFANLFDTRVAEAALGCLNPGLASVLKGRFGIELDKSLQRSDWSRRPLTPRQVDYARLDTHYLIPLMDVLRDELLQRDRLPIVAGECQRLEALEAPERAFDANDFVRIKGVRSLEPIERRRMRELFGLRDEHARRRDMPPFKILSNNLLLSLARSRALSERELAGVPGFSPKLARRFGAPVLAALRRAHEQGPMKSLPRSKSRDGSLELDEVSGELHDRLKSWRKERAVTDGMDSSLVLNRHSLLALARDRPQPDALAGVAGILTWQVERYGQELRACLERFELDLANGLVPSKRRRKRRSDP